MIKFYSLKQLGNLLYLNNFLIMLKTKQKIGLILENCFYYVKEYLNLKTHWHYVPISLTSLF